MSLPEYWWRSMPITILQVPYEKNIGILVSETMKQQWLSTCFVMWSAYCLLEAEQFQLSHERNLPHAHSRTHLKLFISMYPPLKHICEANECLTNTGNVSWAHTHNKPCHMNDSQVKAFYAWCVATELFIPLLCSFLTSRLRKTTLTYLNEFPRFFVYQMATLVFCHLVESVEKNGIPAVILRWN